MADEVYFHGCWAESGHYTWRSSGQMADRGEERAIPWSDFHMLCPGARSGYSTPEDVQIEGDAALHHRSGWTALAWWDRSVDRRHGCQGVLIAEGTWTADEVLRIGRQLFPRVMGRFTYPIVVVSRPTELRHGEVRCARCDVVGRTATLPGGWVMVPPGWFTRSGEIVCGPGCAKEAG